jgi:hypothetical protein
MARNYAGILGTLAFAAVVARNLVHNAAASEAVWQASVMLFYFATIGYAIGRVGQWIVDESVRGRLTIEIASQAATGETGLSQPPLGSG